MSVITPLSRYFASRTRSAGVVVGLMIAMIGSGCANSDDDIAMRLGSFKVTKSELEVILKSTRSIRLEQLKSSNGGQAQVDENGKLIDPTRSESGWKAEFVAESLSSMVLLAALNEEVAARGLKIKALAGKEKDDFLRSQFSTSGDLNEAKKIFATLPKVQQERQLLFVAQVNALLDDDNLVVSYNACVKHILIADLKTALSLQGQLRAGADFATLAKANSKDPGSKVNGGELPCADISSLTPPFAEAVRTAKLNTLTEPVKSQFGYHLIIVTKRDKVTAKSLPEDRRNDAVLEVAQRSMTERAKKLYVNPSLGSAGSDFGPDGPGFTRVYPPGQAPKIPADGAQ
jgi:parvulin-like peptidyl-prolyl isomerase